jgi:streptogramin lyase
MVLSAPLLLALLWMAGVAVADLDVQETELNPDGAVYEVNPGPQGLLWISEGEQEEIWSLDPASGAYTVYQGAGRVSDARRAADGSVWWIDQVDDSLGRLWPATNEATVWKIPGATTLLGTAIDNQGGVWLSQYFDPEVYRFTVGTSQLCTYTLGTSGASDYILAHGSDIWLGDWINDRIHRLDSNSGLLTSWTLPVDSRPEGLALDGRGGFWWADPDLDQLARLEPDLDRLTTYALPLGSAPHMLAVSGNRLWYTEDSRGTLGRFDPFLAIGTSQVLSTTTTSLTPTCSEISPDSSATLSSSTGTASWAGSTYALTHDAGGWWIHDLPLDAFPWGVAARGGQVWLVDNGRQVLAQVADPPSVTACKEEDADGDPATAGDRTPVEGWTLYLVVDGLRQEPGQLTGASGCYTWDGLEAGVSYGVEEDDPAGWTPLAATSHDFGPIQAGTGYDHTFVNAESVEVTACKRADANGDPITIGDQTPIEGWTVYLAVDGQRQEPGQLTGEDGCATWSDLAPGPSYGVEEEERSGWTALTPTNHEFGELPPGESATYTFVNAENVDVTACKLIDDDGELATTGDQTPAEGWTVYLVVDDQRQEPGQGTGPDGCYTWGDLAPALRYGVEEEVGFGWKALTPTSYDFGRAVPGASYEAEFVNTEGLETIFLPLIQR